MCSLASPILASIVIMLVNIEEFLREFSKMSNFEVNFSDPTILFKIDQKFLKMTGIVTILGSITFAGEQIIQELALYS